MKWFNYFTYYNWRGTAASKIESQQLISDSRISHIISQDTRYYSLISNTFSLFLCIFLICYVSSVRLSASGGTLVDFLDDGFFLIKEQKAMFDMEPRSDNWARDVAYLDNLIVEYRAECDSKEIVELVNKLAPDDKHRLWYDLLRNKCYEYHCVEVVTWRFKA